ncbi:hypothetical protein EVG20_g5974 [Dentipellis fragilis]|uniref:F-box domain-containing protein n=1 Tax=Dentipellis fragilis TaxID=205917 RepID=A0A4Y9YTC1_9AGAM|nr:hypothetical protein EVG20_g5974 [Dentipellis fragilis]
MVIIIGRKHNDLVRSTSLAVTFLRSSPTCDEHTPTAPQRATCWLCLKLTILVAVFVQRDRAPSSPNSGFWTTENMTPTSLLPGELKVYESQHTKEKEITRVASPSLQAESKHAQNSLTSANIMDLPVELLCNIFQFCRAAESRYSLNEGCDEEFVRIKKNCVGYETQFWKAYAQAPQWLAICRVCRHWRQVAMSCAPLWTTLDFDDPELTSMFLSLSRQLPLDVKAFLAPKANTDAVKLVMNELQRIKFLVVYAARPSDLQGVLDGHEDGPADLLEEISLTADFYDPDDERIEIYDHTSLQGLLTWQAPRLWSLDISGDRILDDPYPDVLQKLRRLRLHDAREFFNEDSLETLVSALEMMPQLEELKLSSAIPDETRYTGRPDAPDHVVSLPSLRDLQLADEAHLIDRLLQYIDFPCTTTFYVECEVDICEQNGGLQVQCDRLSRICSTIPVNPDAPTQSLCLKNLQTISGWDSPPRSAKNPATQVGFCNFCVKIMASDSSNDEVGDVDDDGLVLLSRAALHAMPVEDVKCMLLYHRDELTLEGWFRNFGFASHTTELSIGPDAVAGFFIVLAMVRPDLLHNAETGSGGVRDGILWPKMRVLTVNLTVYHPEEIKNILVRGLAFRGQIGAPVEYMRVILRVQDQMHELYRTILPDLVPDVVITVES